ncbi:MAG TPA: YggT family protein [Acidimicrobiia bacterium]|nr:YggT family protein [Acidimicrobiia bacterium]
MSILCHVVQAYILVLFGRAILSWLPIRPGSMWSSVNRVLVDLTEPVLAPLRRVIPPAGMIDLSFLVLLVGLSILHSAMGCSSFIF